MKPVAALLDTVRRFEQTYDRPAKRAIISRSFGRNLIEDVTRIRLVEEPEVGYFGAIIGIPVTVATQREEVVVI